MPSPCHSPTALEPSPRSGDALARSGDRGPSKGTASTRSPWRSRNQTLAGPGSMPVADEQVHHVVAELDAPHAAVAVELQAQARRIGQAQGERP